MNGEQKIRTALKQHGLMTAGEANAARIWKGYCRETDRNGWHVQKFNAPPVWWGDTIAEATARIDEHADASAS